MNIMIDTGAHCSFINEHCLEFNDDFNFSSIQHQSFYMVDGFTSFVVTGIVRLNILIGDYVTNIPTFVTKQLCTNIILCKNYLIKYDLDIKPKKKMIVFNFKSAQVILPFNSTPDSINFPVKSSSYRSSPPFSASTLAVPVSAPSSDLSPCTSSTFSLTPSSSSSNISLQINSCSSSSTNVDSTLEQSICTLVNHVTDPHQHTSIRSLLSQFLPQFDTSKYTVATTTITHAIETYPHTPPVSKPYQSSPTLIAEMRSVIDNLLNAGLIRPSTSSYAASALLVKKKDRTWRLVIDYKKLNPITIPDCYPLPNIEITLQILGAGYKYFSKLDLKFGFWQLPIAAKDCYKTAFITPFGLFEWLVLPQGLRNSPPTFQRIMNNILGHFSNFCLVYLDDIVIFSRDFNEHLLHLNKVLYALKIII